MHSARAAQETITSRDNRWLKRFRAALEGVAEKAPARDGECVGLEGPRLVEEAFRSGLRIEAVLVCDAGERNLSRLKPWMTPEVRVLRCSDRLFAGVAATETPQGIAALARVPEWEFEELLGADARTREEAALEGGAGGLRKDAALKGSATSGAPGAALVIVMVGLQDPGNVGALVRSAEALGATGAVACRGTAHPYSPKAMRASAGSALRLPVRAGMEPESALERLREAGLRVYAASVSSGVAPAEADLWGPCALLVGNEAAGLPPALEQRADAKLRIPLAEGVDSLNAAVAGAVLMYEAARQRSANRAARAGDTTGNAR
jgi:TrmH family RNA methyltransferase